MNKVIDQRASPQLPFILTQSIRKLEPTKRNNITVNAYLNGQAILIIPKTT